jgi:hypothetical protein
MLDNEINQEVEINNSVASILSKTLKSIVSKLPSQEEMGGIVKDLPSMIAQFSKPVKKKKVIPEV